MHMQKQKLLIHIGTHKTGSTALQQFCSANRQTLRNQGLCFPLAGSVEGNHYNIVWEIAADSRYKQQIGMLSDVILEIQETGLEFNLLSSEEFEYLTEDAIARLAERLYTHNLQPTVVVYLRRQDELIRSEYLECIKNGSLSLTFQNFLTQHLGHPRFNYLHLLSTWSRVFGKPNLKVLIYDRDLLTNGNLVDDFFSRIFHETKIPGSDTLHIHANKSYGKKHLSAYLLAAAYLRAVYRFENQYELAPIMAEVKEHIDKWISEGDPFIGFRHGQRQMLLNSFKISNETVAKEYFGRNDLFSPDPLIEADDVETACISLNEAHALISHVNKVLINHMATNNG